MSKPIHTITKKSEVTGKEYVCEFYQDDCDPFDFEGDDLFQMYSFVRRFQPDHFKDPKELFGTEDPLHFRDAALKAKYHVFPLYKFEHSGIALSIHDFNDRWDSGQIGWVLVHPKDYKMAYGKDAKESKLSSRVEEFLRTYTKYLNGEIYYYTISVNGKVEESLGGMIGFDFAEAEAERSMKDMMEEEDKKEGKQLDLFQE